MKLTAKLLYAFVLAISSFAYAGCNNNGAPPAKFTIGGTVVNLAGTAGGLTLQDNLQNNLAVNANGTFTFATAVAGNTAYSITISTQPSNPAQTCGVTNGSGTATANITNIQINCGHNEWAWMKGPNTPSNNGTYGTLSVSGANNNPGGRQTPVTWTDASGNLWLFGGYGFDSIGALLPMNDMWKYSGGQWAWTSGPNIGGQNGTYGTLGVPAITNIPGARAYAVSSTDGSGDLWLFGGNGYDSTGKEASLNDLWKYSGGEWTWMSGSNLADQQGAYGTLGVAAASNIPGSRDNAVSWMDSSGDFWLFGGLGYDSTGTIGLLNDLWKYSNGEWTWESGSKLVNQHAVYGTQGLPAPGNVPGTRYWAVGWTDPSGNLWLFGGTGYVGTGTSGSLNDLWKYSNGQWTWVAGSPVLNQAGTYGTQGVASSSNNPGGRQNGISWTDSSGNLWLVGGAGIDSTAQAGVLNDVWKCSNGEWTWISGSKLVNQNGVYGVQGTLAPGNVPGARFVANRWIDANGNLWFFGGYGVPASGSEGDLSDLWMYMP